MEKDADKTDIHERLALLRKPFPDHQIGKLPKGTKAQNDCPASEKANCKICGGWHHPRIVHLDYVGHAATTDRLLDADPSWSWEPMAYSDGLPKFDSTGGLWIKLTVCGVTRIGYGHAAAASFKDIGSREKEVIGDAIRNAAMRFGCGLEHWHKGELHVADEAAEAAEAAEETAKKLPVYPDDKFQLRYKNFKDAVSKGRATTQEIIATISSSYILTPEQLNAILELK